MLDTDTKARIDSARDILVGKVPDPKSQVEQITIALIYKFMDDMDSQSEGMGGKASFFTGEFKKYRWPNLLDRRLGGHERLLLYAEGIEKMNENRNIPQLFRDIFRGVFLPYRDPETLNLFLKEIGGFSYDHSERLGDAYEYLLSVLGTQGDAGQFRTPRHIIDFITNVVDPKKSETVLDPACGTAGFLISAYKHILKENQDLTPDERALLMTNFRGYDIAPDMVRLSRVNMYLHGFPNPVIHEYDTLTSEERWDERYDVILANPPFMSPKGGIRPHNRFSIRATRSEVLFVDYIAEHLNPGGRAGVIVPEGIIFQSQNAYKQLRRMLVENHLWCVVSLPAGVFNPYSGVKTSILFLDRNLARRAASILFMKVENDGFGLGAQRREIEKNDLPLARGEITEYLHRLHSGEPIDDYHPNLGLIVPKEEIAANGDYNLSVERYRKGARLSHKHPLLRIADICTINPRKSKLAELSPNTVVSFVPMADLNEHSISFRPREEKRLSDVSASYTYFEDNDVLLAKVTPCFENGKAGVARDLTNGIGFGSSELYVLRPTSQVLPEWIYFCLTHPLFRESAIAQMTGTGGLQRVPRGHLEDFEIPLPPLDVQREIVAEIESYQKVIDGARVVLENYRPHIAIQPDWPKRQLGRLAENLDSRRVPITKGDRKKGPFPYYGASGIVDYVADYIFDEDILLISEDGANLLARSTPIAFSVSGKCWVNNHAHVLKFENPVTQKFVEVYLNAISIEEFVTGAAQPKLNQKALNGIPIPIPDNFATQQAIVAEIEAEQALVESNRKLIEMFERKIQARLAEMWGEDPGKY